MPSIEACVAFDHNVWLVLAAAGVCVFGSWAVLGLFERAMQAEGGQRFGWQALAAISAGASIWCTHFVAILAYRPGVPIGFDPFLTIASALIAAIGAGLGILLAMAGRSKLWAPAGGALLGLSIGAMHYSGMLAFRIEGLVHWRMPTLLASLAIGSVFAAASLYVAKHGASVHRRIFSIGLLAAAIVGLHFTGMAALKITPLLVDVGAVNDEAYGTLALAIVGMTLLIVGTGVVSSLIDRDVRADSYKRLRAMALHDGLTDLPNRAYFHEYLQQRIAEARVAGAKVALVALDLQGLKEVNDQFGHAVGDTVLARFAERLRKSLSAEEFAARLGGDEFAVVQVSHNPNGVADLAKRLSQIFSAPIIAGEFAGRISASMGVAVLPDDASELESLVNNAVLAMYRAKADDSEDICFYESSMEEGARARRRMAADLRSAISNNELEVHYQIQLAVDGGAVVGFEALARWTRDGAYVPPSEFIPVAEQYGLIEDLGHWVLKTACAEAARWDVPYKVAVNLSPVQLTRPGLPLSVAAILQETGLPPSRLELELTESALIRDAKSSLRALRQIRELGVTIALDDFGTGFSSLSTLRSFPFDKIKLDRSFLREIETDAQAKAVLRAVLSLGKGLGIPVLTEGVETQGQLDMLRAEGCSQAQGYLLGRPAPMSHLIADGILVNRPPASVARQPRVAA